METVAKCSGVKRRHQSRHGCAIAALSLNTTGSTILHLQSHKRILVQGQHVGMYSQNQHCSEATLIAVYDTFIPFAV